ncbi:hydroxypyruvate isomerase family protein [Roseibium sediminicola]|uniref:TIM barrel protein n=1 Tax=Roseibium sediminicola TaxID=2933272 RepID=A0ABT0H4E7_9HYPH|nr:TIM barrel protein [Roseibium sp. CAU 1639]MCK7616167.1 TIM barrel protein [Roseibium sp. CAU 1639]
MPTFCAHLGYLFNELDPVERFSAASNAGFDWIEHPAPYGIGISQFLKLAQTNGLKIAQIAAPVGTKEGHEKGFACLPECEAEFIQSVESGIVAAKKLSCRFLHVMSGTVPAGQKREQLRSVYSSRIAIAAEMATRADMYLLIEPIDDNAVTGYFMNDPAYAVEVVQEIAKPNVKLLFDVYHAHNRGIDAVDFYKDYSGLIGHIQIADAPGRHEPGTGKIEFDRLFSLLDSSGYDGVVGLEYVPSGNTSNGLVWRQHYVR